MLTSTKCRILYIKIDGWKKTPLFGSGGCFHLGRCLQEKLSIWPHIYIKMLSCQYRHSNYKDKTVSRPSYLYNGNTNTLKESLYIETEPWWLSNTEQYGITIASLSKGVAGDTVMLSTQTFAYFIKGTHMLPRLDQAKFHINWTANNWITAAGTQVTLYVFLYFWCLLRQRFCQRPGSAFIKPDQLDPGIKDQIKITLLPTISHLQLLNFVSRGRACPSHMKQNLVTVVAKLWTAECFLFDPWSMDQADLVW